MREVIRFAWGRSTLGAFIVALSEKGLVALEFGSHPAEMEAHCACASRRPISWTDKES